MAINFPTTANVGEIYSANTKSWSYTGYGWKAVSAAGSLVSSNTITYTATAGQTSFTTPTYLQGANQVSVFINGVRQYPDAFAESTNTTITLTNGATLDDNVLIQVSGYTGNPIAIGTTTIVDDNVTNAVRYPLMAQSTSGSLTLVNTASTDLTFNPGTGVMYVPTIQFSDGTTISTSFAAAGSYANGAFTQANAAYTRANNTINANTGGTITGNTTITGNLFVSNTTTSVSNTTGALTVDGGVGVQGNVYINGSFYSNNIIVPTLTVMLTYQLAF